MSRSADAMTLFDRRGFLHGSAALGLALPSLPLWARGPAS